MSGKKLKDFLDSQGVKYVTITHSPAYTAQQIADSAHISGKQVAKTVMVEVDGEMSMAVLPAPYKINFDLLKGTAGAKHVRISSEAEFKDRFPDCEVGAMPPFGNLYGMPVYVAEILSEDEEIAFNAGSHSELVKLPYEDFERLVKPKLGRFSNAYA